MQSLVGVHIKNEIEEIVDDQTVLHPFMLIFPNKKRIYYLKSRVMPLLCLTFKIVGKREMDECHKESDRLCECLRLL